MVRRLASGAGGLGSNSGGVMCGIEEELLWVMHCVLNCVNQAEAIVCWGVRVKINSYWIVSK